MSHHAHDAAIRAALAASLGRPVPVRLARPDDERQASAPAATSPAPGTDEATPPADPDPDSDRR